MINFYAQSGQATGAVQTQRERTFRKLFEYCASLGEQPILVAMDANVSITASGALTQVLSSGKWTDLASHFGIPEPTFNHDPSWDRLSNIKGSTRPDVIFANPCALALCQSFQLRRDLACKGHLGLELQLNCRIAADTMRVWTIPKSLPCKPKTRAGTLCSDNARCENLLQQEIPNIDEQLAAGNTQEVWVRLGAVAQKYLRQQCNSAQQHKHGSAPRNLQPHFHQRNVACSSASCHLPSVAGNYKLVQCFALLRKIRELQHKQWKYANKMTISTDCLTESPILWNRIKLGLQSLKLLGNFQLTQSWIFAPTEKLWSELYKLSLEWCKDITYQRVRAWKTKLRESFKHKGSGREAFQWLRGGYQPPVRAVKCNNGTIVTQPNQVLSEVQKSWQQLFNQSQLLPVEPLLDSLNLQSVPPVEIPDITGQDLVDHIVKVKSSRAIAFDGWRVAEAQSMPVSYCTAVAKIFTAVENGQKWPESLTQGIISTIPNTSEDNADDRPSGSLIAANGLDTRPITNLSFWLTAYSSIRFRQLKQWRETWLPVECHGARNGHSTHNNSWPLALALEKAHAQCSTIIGISMDRRKFFDLLQYAVGHGIMQRLGVPEKILIAEKAFYQQLHYKYKIGKNFSTWSTRCNGFVQGCSWSVQVALGAITMWVRYLKLHCLPSPQLNLGTFVDDCHMYAEDDDPSAAVSAVVNAWKHSLNFDQLAGMQTNAAKSSYFSTTLEGEQTMKAVLDEYPEYQRLASKNSFLLTGAVITSRGRPDLGYRKRRVQKCIQKLRKIRYAPVAFVHRVRMIQSASIPTVIFGTELQAITLQEHESIRRATVAALWKTSWCRCAATTLTIVLPGHLICTRQASVYNAFCIARKILNNNQIAKDAFETLWYLYQDENVSDKHGGPFSILQNGIRELGAEWTSPFCLQFDHGETFHLLEGQEETWRHQLRCHLRLLIWKSNKALNTRQDMQGGPVFAYEPSVLLLRKAQSGKHQHYSLSFHEITSLRCIVTGAVRTQDRLYKANAVKSPVCPWCNSGHSETVMHLFWQCERWQHLREQMDLLQQLWEQLPPCFLQCGLLPQSLIDNGTISKKQAEKLCTSVQKMMISILKCRDSLQANKKQLKHDQPNSCQSPSHEHHHHGDEPSRQEALSLFPTYPWEWDKQKGTKHFFGKIPPDWRVYSKGGSWTWNPALFPALVWYWRSLIWPSEPDMSETISFAELAIDFQLATHVSLDPSGDINQSQSFHTQSRIFAAASRRMAKICKASLVPAVLDESPFAEHVPVLTSLGLGRCAGLKCRPCLTCPAEVHEIFFTAALQSGADKNIPFKKLFPTIRSWPTPKWNGTVTRTRLFGKQPDPSIPQASQKRVVRAHKSSIESIQWSNSELQEIQQADDWRQRQRIEKKILHNRTAEAEGKHVILPFSATVPAKCKNCLKVASNKSGISRFMNETCGGSLDIGNSRDQPQ